MVTDGETHASELAKLFFVLGQVALLQLIYIEDIHKEMRHKRLEKEQKSKKLVLHSNSLTKSRSAEDEEAIEKELGNAQAAQQEQDEKDEAEAKKQVRVRSSRFLRSQDCNGQSYRCFYPYRHISVCEFYQWFRGPSP